MDPQIQGPLNGGVSNGGVSRSGLVLPFFSFLGLSRFFWDFPDLLGDGLGIFPIRPFPLTRPIKSTYEEQSPKGSATQSRPFPKEMGNTPVWKPPGLASLGALENSKFSPRPLIFGDLTPPPQIRNSKLSRRPFMTRMAVAAVVGMCVVATQRFMAAFVTGQSQAVPRKELSAP